MTATVRIAFVWFVFDPVAHALYVPASTGRVAEGVQAFLPLLLVLGKRE